MVKWRYDFWQITKVNINKILLHGINANFIVIKKKLKKILCLHSPRRENFIIFLKLIIFIDGYLLTVVFSVNQLIFIIIPGPWWSLAAKDISVALGNLLSSSSIANTPVCFYKIAKQYHWLRNKLRKGKKKL